MTNYFFSPTTYAPHHPIHAIRLTDECKDLICCQVDGENRKERTLSEKIKDLSFENLIELHEFTTKKGQERITALHQMADRNCKLSNLKKTYWIFGGLSIAIATGAIKMSRRSNRCLGLSPIAIALSSVGLGALYIAGFCSSYFFAAKISRLVLRSEETKMVSSAQNAMFRITDLLARGLIISSNITKNQLQRELDYLTHKSADQMQKITDQSALITKNASMIKTLRTTIGMEPDLAPQNPEIEKSQSEISQSSPDSETINSALQPAEARRSSMVGDTAILPDLSTLSPASNSESKHIKSPWPNRSEELSKAAADLTKQSTATLQKTADLLDTTKSLVEKATSSEKS